MSQHELWYEKPGMEWKQGLPLGNGVLGAMWWGPPETSRFTLNHEWLWRAEGRHRDIEPVPADTLDEIRRLLLAGEHQAGADLANEFLGGPGGISGRPNRVDSFQPAGELVIESPLQIIYPNRYRRSLNLHDAIAREWINASMEPKLPGGTIERQAFVHATHPLLAVHLSAEPHKCLDMNVRLARLCDPRCTVEVDRANHQQLQLKGNFPEGVAWCILADMDVTDGQIAPASRDGMEIRQATSATIRLTLAVALDGGDPVAKAHEQLAGASDDVSALRASHVEAHQQLYDRVSLDLGGEDRSDIPTDERIAVMRDGGHDRGLLELYVNYGRYLLICSSRPGCEVPANLQGLWNDKLLPAWDCDLHQDINIQMNYWLAEVTGLGQCATPLFEHIYRCVPHGREAAKKLYGCRGVWLPIQTDPWGRNTPESCGYAVWVGAASWLALHLWWQWEFQRDEDLLREQIYPYHKEVAAFWEDYLIRDGQGRLVPVPSQSPENTFVGGARPVGLCVGATMDLMLIRESLTHAIQAAEILGVDAERRQCWQQIIDDLPPLQIGRHGQLQEWLEDFEEAEPGHRHISHLYDLFPGDALTPESQPELTRAARVSLERRLAAEGGHTGWSRAWTVCCWARLGEGDLAREHLEHLVTDFATDTLLDLHPPEIFQIEGNLGGAAGVVEMLLQSHGNRIRFLPALPTDWLQGQVQGLHARGGFVVNLSWQNGQLTSAELTSQLGSPACLAGTDWIVEHYNGQPAKTSTDGNCTKLQTHAGETFVIRPG
jgi:alpha-L-fucosidase 2